MNKNKGTNSSLNIHLLYMTIASFCFACTGALARLLKDDYTSVQLVLFRNVIGIPFLFYFIYSQGFSQKGGRPLLLFIRGFVGTLALYFFFYGVTTIGLPESITYQQSYPIFLALISVFFLNEKLSSKAWWSILIGFVGLCLIFIPKMSSNALEFKSHIIGLINLVLTGSAYLSIRGLSDYYDKKIIVLSFMLCGIIMPILSFILSHFLNNNQLDFIIADFKSIQLKDCYLIIPLGLIALIGQVYLTKAFTHRETGVIGAMGYSNVVFSIFLGSLIGDEMPSFSSFLGIILIIISGVLLSLVGKSS